MEIIIKGEAKEIAALVVALQERQVENALYDYKNGVKYTLPSERINGGGGG